jgi:hypothetical protein
VVFPLFLLCVGRLVFSGAIGCSLSTITLCICWRWSPHTVALSYHSYLRDVGGDGSVLGGVDIEIDVAREGATPTRFFFWPSASAGSWCPYEVSALQAVRFFQRLYGFVVRDFNYEGMQAYRNLAWSAVVLAVLVAWSGRVVLGDASDGSVYHVSEPVHWQNAL